MESFWRYFLLGSAFWFVVDFTTAFSPDVGRWVSYMPAVWAFYFGAPLLFAYLIYRRHWDDTRIFAPVLFVLFVVEIVFTGNALLFTFPLMLVMVPIAIGIYGFITYVPRWMVDGRLRENGGKAALMSAIWIGVAALSFATRAGG